jgi:hypothetical protein
MIAPPPFVVKCPKCGHTKTVRPRSDALNPADVFPPCPKCKTPMMRTDEKPGLVSELLDKLFPFRA